MSQQHLQTFIRLLNEAHSAQKAVDNFDLYSEEEASNAKFEELRGEWYQASLFFTAFVSTHAKELVDEFLKF